MILLGRRRFGLFLSLFGYYVLLVVGLASPASASRSASTIQSSSATTQSYYEDTLSLSSQFSRPPSLVHKFPSTSLSERMESLLFVTEEQKNKEQDDEFVKRLKQAEIQDEKDRIASLQTSSVSDTVVPSVLFWTVTGGILVALATGGTSRGNGIVSAVMGMFWREGGESSTSSTGITGSMTWSDMIVSIKSFAFAEPAREFLYETVLPQAIRTMQLITVKELWNLYLQRLWKELGRLVHHFRPSSSTSSCTSDDTSDQSSTASSTWSWLYEKHQALVTIIERASKKIVQSSLQKYLHSHMAKTMLDWMGKWSSRGAEVMRPDLTQLSS